MNEHYIAVGLMSGTSADGIDAVLVRTDGMTPPRVLAELEMPFADDLHQRILALYQTGTDELERLGRLHRELGERFAEAALAVARQGGLSMERVDVIGSHGQTVRHRPPFFTWQIGDPFIIAARTGVTTVADFRPADLAQGGEGAPLAPLFHQVLFGRPGQRVAVVNLGGIANVTALPGHPEHPLVAGDIGPANSLIDLLATRLGNGQRTMDHHGTAADQGTVDRAVLAELLDHPYLQRPFPKSTGREEFGAEFLHTLLTRHPHLNGVDGLATLTQFTAQIVADGCMGLLPPAPNRVILCGGGARNRSLVARLQRCLPPGVRISDAEDLGVNAATLEAQAFAWFAVRTLKGLPSSLPQATGARIPAILGSIHPVAPCRAL
ncbi:MAG: anhydro-N-acetylmuramic acid kinase [Magnetococcales bacterium]|nr:anhydro-N-acetylmuramic acid kinase [Magnetococcales bacterium]